jgi:hypothetical protein
MLFWKPVYLYPASLYFLPKPVPVDVDILKLCIELLVLLSQKPDRLAVVIMDNQLMARVESQVSKEASPLDGLFRCIGKS